MSARISDYYMREYKNMLGEQAKDIWEKLKIVSRKYMIINSWVCMYERKKFSLYTPFS